MVLGYFWASDDWDKVERTFWNGAGSSLHLPIAFRKHPYILNTNTMKIQNIKKPPRKKRPTSVKERECTWGK